MATDTFHQVSINYRLGAFGWLAGSGFQKDGGFENAGLTDQMMAISWVRNNINLFGGDPYDITLIGESAGASSILHHLTAWGGKNPKQEAYPLWSKAIIQSPAFFPQVPGKAIDDMYQSYLDAADAKDLAELRNKSTEVLLYANRKTIYSSPYGQFTYGPTVSGGSIRGDKLVPVPPSLLLSVGLSWNAQLMIANNRREGSLFTPPWLRTSSAVKDYINFTYPAFDQDDLAKIPTLYPVDTGKLVTAKAKFLQAAAPFGDLAADCNVWALRKRYASGI